MVSILIADFALSGVLPKPRQNVKFPNAGAEPGYKKVIS